MTTKGALRKKRDPELLARGFKECFKCFTVKPFVDFTKLERGAGGRAAYCRKCHAVYVLEQRAKDPLFKQKLAAYRQGDTWKTLHCGQMRRRRAVKKGVDTGTVGVEEVRKLYAQTVCYYCKRETPRAERTMDHKVALHVGGLHDVKNIVMACGRCNSSKRVMTEKDYKRKLHGLRLQDSR